MRRAGDRGPSRRKGTMSAAPVTYSYAGLELGDSIAVVLKDFPAFQTRIDPHAGRPILLCFLPSLSSPEGVSAVEQLAAEPDLDSRFAARILVTGPSAAGQDELPTVFSEKIVDPGFRILRAFGVAPRETAWNGEAEGARVGWVIVGPSLHVLSLGSFLRAPNGASRLSPAIQQLSAMLAPYGVPRPPPILILPNVFSPALCKALVEAYDRNGGAETGVVINNETVLMRDLKRRRDYFIQEPELIRATHASLTRRILPEIERLFFMKCTRMTRNIVACYAAAEGGHFLRPHRDNIAPETVQRRFAVSVNLVDGFEGGEVVFPEYGDTGYKVPAGWALVFPCNIVHLVTQVEAGARYVWLPFVYE